METPVQFTARDLSSMVGHWLSTPPNGYLGQSYGSDVKAILQTPMSAGLANGLIAKCKTDVPLARSGNVNVFSYDTDIDKKAIVFEVAGEIVSVGGA